MERMLATPADAEIILRLYESVSYTHLLEVLETQLTSSEVFTALFELEMTGRVRCLPGKNYVRTL